jgi:serine/threonine protein kinase
MTSFKKWIDSKIEDGDINYFEYNNFSNIKRISEGGFGVINSAHWNNGGVKVALKSLLYNLMIDENQKENFLRGI